MSDPWPGRVVDDHPDNAWPGKIVGTRPLKTNKAIADPDGPMLKDRGADYIRDAIRRGDGPSVQADPSLVPPKVGPRLLPAPTAIDGDTIKSDVGRVRVWGIDAPELTQQGWDRQGNAVPIGQQSRDWLQGAIQTAGLPRLGSVQGSSYGRMVGPVTLGNTDAGLASVRTGNALAAPSFVQDDPGYLTKLMQAERLARLNRLGPMHDNYVPQTPAQVRHDGPITPARETIPQFFDTPTPLQGLPADKEAQLRKLYETGTAAEINAFLSANGYQTSRPADLAAFIAKRDKGAKVDPSVTYNEAPPLMIDSGDGAGGAAVRKFGSGFLMGGLDEAGAFVDMLGGTGGRENIFNSDRRLADIWLNNQRQNAGILSYDQTAHPYASTGGEIAGALTSGLVIPYGQGARTAAQLGRVGAVYGAAGGFLSTDGSVTDRLKGAAIGAPVGMVLNAGIGKAIEHGAPLVGAGVKRLFGRDATKPAEAAGEVAGEYASDNAFNAAEALPEGAGGNVWPGRIVDRLELPEGGSGGSPWPQPAKIETAYPGPAVGSPRNVWEVQPEVDQWAASQAPGAMYHGSASPDIREFDPYGKSAHGLYGQGTYLTDNPAVALGYTGKGLGKGDPVNRTIYAVEHGVKNPLDMDAPADPAKWAGLAEREGFDVAPGMTNGDAYRAFEEALRDQELPHYEGAEAAAEGIRSMGYDGVTHIGGGRYGAKDGPNHRVVIALDPEQTTIRNRLNVGELMKPPVRNRDWIDVAQYPPEAWPGRVVSNDNAVERTIGMDAEPMQAVSGLPRQRDYLNLSPSPRPRRLLDPANDAERMAAAERVQPGDVLPIASNAIDGPEEAAAVQAGRFAEAKAPNERSALSSGTVRAWNGAEVPKVGPTDLIGWLRLRGGLQDEGGELSHMGFTNAARRGLDHVGQEARFGPLVNPEGDALDDATMAAWEAGFFPEHTERPSVNDFLEALGDTYNGGAGRRFRVDDYPELERFEAMRAERYDLEQQQHEAGTVWQDRSVPADDAAPFPPPEAYEEWPSDAIKRVGNVDVTKLDTPQDIARALKTSYNAMGGFDAATRGRVTQAETERLASELGMTADDLLARRKGQALNAEEALAARQILAKSGNELVNLARKIQRVEKPGDEEAAAFQRALMRHAAIQEQVSGATAEAGRALAQFRMMAESRAVSAEVLAGIRDAGGGTGRIKQAADLLLDAIEGPPGRFNTVARKAANPRFSDKLAELYINFLLSGPQTHVVNAVSNTMTAISQIPENALAAAFGGARKLAARKEVDRVMGGEIGARLFGLLQGTREGAELFARALKTGETSDTFSKISGHDMRAISGLKGEVIRIPGRLLNSADEFYKGINRRAEINALAYRQAHREGLEGDALKARIAELSANPTENIELRGLDFARYMTFQRPLGGLGQKASQLSREFPLLRPIITFVRTPANLLKFAAERSPAAPLLKEWRADFKAGGARRDLAMARAMLGTGFATAFYMGALEGRVTGSAPSDEAKNRYMRADGWQPYSVRIGDTWVSYSRLDPFAIQLGVAADLALRADGMTDKQLDNYAMLTVASIMAQMADKTWLSGVSDFTQALQDPERYGRSYLRRLGASFAIPNLSAQTARTIDPVTRERGTFGEELQSRIPGLSDDLLPKRDIWGRPITSDNEIGPDLLNPFRQSSIKHDPVNAAMLDIGARFGPPSKQHTVAGKKVDWTPEQYDKLQEIAGHQAHSGIAELISRTGWRNMPNAAKLKAAEKVFESARQTAKGVVLGTASAPAAGAEAWPGKRIGGAPQGLMADPWPGKPVASRDVVGDLQRAIPGIQFTSGIRSPEYNESLRARGYHPATNSEHLDGSALDMLPPPGKSLAWLMGRVKQYDPKARLLVHDGHLHGGFNDFYNAPKLGGMRGR